MTLSPPTHPAAAASTPPNAAGGAHASDRIGRIAVRGDAGGRRSRRDVALAMRLVSRAARYRWKLNPHQIAAMWELLPPGGVALDVGAHKGAYSCWMGWRVGRRGRVLAFEPQDRLVGATARSLWVLGLRQVRLLHCAVSDRTGEGTIAVRRASTHGASMEGFDDAADGEIMQQPLSLVTLDDAATAEGLARVDFIKIDVEGHEMSVLRGARGILSRFGPAVLVEIEARHHEGKGGGEGRADPIGMVRGELEPLGYRGWFFDGRGRRPIEEFSVERHQRYGEGFYSNDFLFVRA